MKDITVISSESNSGKLSGGFESALDDSAIQIDADSIDFLRLVPFIEELRAKLLFVWEADYLFYDEGPYEEGLVDCPVFTTEPELVSAKLQIQRELQSARDGLRKELASLGIAKNTSIINGTFGNLFVALGLLEASDCSVHVSHYSGVDGWSRSKQLLEVARSLETILLRLRSTQVRSDKSTARMTFRRKAVKWESPIEVNVRQRRVFRFDRESPISMTVLACKFLKRLVLAKGARVTTSEMKSDRRFKSTDYVHQVFREEIRKHFDRSFIASWPGQGGGYSLLSRHEIREYHDSLNTQ